MKILICDDNREMIGVVEKYIEEFANDNNISFEIDKYSDGKDVIQKKNHYDIAFLDVEMPEIDGLKTTKHLKSINPDITVFIITAFQGYLDEAMDLSVFRYLSKPIDKNRFMKSMYIAMENHNANDKDIVIVQHSKHILIPASKIIYVTIQDRKTKIVTADKTYIGNEKLAYFNKELCKFNYFVQCHYSFVVNLKYVINFDKTHLRLRLENEEVEIPISRSNYTSFKNTFYTYMGGTV